jgi:hypothetical protein
MKVGPLRKAFLARMGEGPREWAYEPPIRWPNRFPDEVVFPLARIRFEDAEFSCPACPERYLETMYGSDYMTPPPEDKRGAHAVNRYLITGPNPHFSGLQWKDYEAKKRAAAGGRA